MSTVSNPATLTSIQSVFGGPGNLTSYYAGGAYVPSGASGPNGTVPSSGNIDIFVFAGVSNYLDTQTVGVGSQPYGGGPFTEFGFDDGSSFCFSPGSPIGSCSPGVSAIYGTTIHQIACIDASGGNLQWIVDGNQSGGWSTMIINGTPYSYGSFNVSYDSFDDITTFGIFSGAGNPFGSSGTITVNWVA